MRTQRASKQQNEFRTWKAIFLLFQLNRRRKKKQVAKIFMTIDKKKVQRWLDARWVDLSMLKREKTIAMRPTRNKFQSRVTRWMTYRTELLLWFRSLLMPILLVIIIILSFRFTFFLRNFDSFEFNTQNEKQIACKQKTQRTEWQIVFVQWETGDDRMSSFVLQFSYWRSPHI